MLQNLYNTFSLPRFQSILKYVFRRAFKIGDIVGAIGVLSTREGDIPVLLNPLEQYQSPLSMCITTTPDHWRWSLNISVNKNLSQRDQISFYIGHSACSPYLIEGLEMLRKKRQITHKHLFKLFNQHHFDTDLCNRMITPMCDFSPNHLQNGLNLLMRTLFLRLIQEYSQPLNDQLKLLFNTPTLNNINELFPAIFTLFSLEKISVNYAAIPETKEMKTLLLEITKNVNNHIGSLSENNLNKTQFAITPNFMGRLFETIFTPRKKSSSYYTPIPVINYMSEHLIFYYLDGFNISHQTIRDLFDLPEPLIDPKEQRQIVAALEQFTLLDPAVGSGDFLVNILDKLTILYQKLTHLNRKSIIQRLLPNIYGIDILFGAANIARLRLLFLFLKESPDIKEIQRFNNMISHNIIVANTLIDQEKITLNLPENFSAIIGNPPYLGEKGNRALFQEIKKGYLGAFHQSRIDLFYLFFHFALEKLTPGGFCSYLTTNYYLTANSGQKLRDDLAKRATLLELFDFNESRLFPDAIGQHNLITLFKKESSPDQNCIVTRSIHKGYCNHQMLKSLLFSQTPLVQKQIVSNRILFQDSKERMTIPVTDQLKQSIFQKLLSQSRPLSYYCNVNQGIVSGSDRITAKHLKKFPELSKKLLHKGIFMLDYDNIKDQSILKNLTPKELEILYPLFKSSDIYHYKTREKTHRKILYCDQPVGVEKQPNIWKHLVQEYSVLNHRLTQYHEQYHWSRLHRPRQKSIFMGAKIVVPQRASYNRFGYNTIPWFASADIYFITQKEDITIDLIYILTILNSKPFYLWLYHNGKRKGNLLELYQTPLLNLPIPCFPHSLQIELIKLGKQLIQADRFDLALFQKIDHLIYSGYYFSSKEIEIIEKNYPG